MVDKKDTDSEGQQVPEAPSGIPYVYSSTVNDGEGGENRVMIVDFGNDKSGKRLLATYSQAEVELAQKLVAESGIEVHQRLVQWAKKRLRIR